MRIASLAKIEGLTNPVEKRLASKSSVVCWKESAFEDFPLPIHDMSLSFSQLSGSSKLPLRPVKKRSRVKGEIRNNGTVSSNDHTKRQRQTRRFPDQSPRQSLSSSYNPQQRLVTNSNFLASIELKQKLDLTERNGEDLPYCRSLTTLQKNAVFADSKPLMIVACAGSGKTRTLTTRICHFLHRGAQSQRILAITFTRKAAEELRQRIEKLMGWKKAAGVLIANFHQFALRILRRHYSEIGFKNQFMVLGAKDQRDVIEECVAKYEKTCRKGELVASMTQANNENGEEEDQVIEMMIGRESKGSSSKSKKNNTTSSRVVNYFVNFIRKAKRQQKSPKDFEDHAHCTIYKHYIDELRNRQAIDFSDMIPLTLHLFNKRADILKQTRQNFKYVFVDEFQDLSKDQFELMRLIASDGGHLTVCGDDDQSIYGWRGATVQGFDLFAKTFKDHQIVVLNQTFRNTKTIVAAVSSLIKKNKKRREKVLWTENGRGEMIDFKVLRDRHKEAQTVIDEIKLRMNKFGLRYKAFAILTRTRRALKATSECLKRNQIPYKNSAATSKPFGQTKQVLDLIAYLDLVAKDDDKAFERVINTPKRGLGLSVLSNVRELANSVGKSYMKAARMAVKSKLRGITARGVTALRKFILTISNFREYSQGRPIRDILDNIITTIGYYSYIQKSCSKTDELEHKMGAVKRLLQRAAGYDNTNHSNPSLKLKDRIRDFTRQIKRKENEKENASDHVTLSTIHQAKGLEWPVVFLIHFNDGILPLPPRTDDKAKELLQIEEERRLAYVAMSRAKLKLCIRCIQRDEMGTPLLPSRFLDDVPPKLLGDCDEKQSTTTNKTPSHKGSTAPSETPAYGVKNHLSPLHAANEGLDHTLSRDSKEPFVKASKLLKEKRENNLSVVSPTNRNDVIPLQGKAAICSLSQTVSRKVKNTSKLKKGKGEKHHRKNCKSKKRTSTGSVLGFRI